MRLIYYPDYEEASDLGFLKSFLTKDLRRHRHLMLLVTEFLKKLERTESLDPYLKTQEIKYLPHLGYFEMRIPPQQRGGVVRIYFVRAWKDPNSLVLLDAELKKRTSSCIRDRTKKRKRAYIQSHSRCRG